MGHKCGESLAGSEGRSYPGKRVTCLFQLGHPSRGKGTAHVGGGKPNVTQRKSVIVGLQGNFHSGWSDGKKTNIPGVGVTQGSKTTTYYEGSLPLSRVSLRVSGNSTPACPSRKNQITKSGSGGVILHYEGSTTDYKYRRGKEEARAYRLEIRAGVFMGSRKKHSRITAIQFCRTVEDKKKSSCAGRELW